MWDGLTSSLLSSVVVAIAADVAVMDGWRLRRLAVHIGAIEPMLQSRLDRAVARRADVVAACAGRFDAGRAVAACEPQNTETGAEALFGMRLGLHDRLDERDRGGTDLGGFSPHPARRPFCVAPMRAWHVFGDRRVAMSCVRASVACHSGALVQNLDRGVGDARFQLLANE